MTKTEQKKTFSSVDAEYPIDNKDLFHMVIALDRYVHEREWEYLRAGGDIGRFGTYLRSSQ